jgi:hypothetical protein
MAGRGRAELEPYALCGTPLLANSQSAPYYLPHILAMLLPTWLAVGALAYFTCFGRGWGWGYGCACGGYTQARSSGWDCGC